MAAILQILLDGQIRPDQLICCMSANKKKQELPTVLQDFENARQEFVPFFLNYIRDQTAHLFSGCHSASASPAKTPTSLKTKTPNSFPSAVNKTATSTPKLAGTGRLNRTQLFAASPLENKQNHSLGLGDDDSLSFTLESPKQNNSSYNKSFSLDSSKNDSSLLGSASRKSGGGSAHQIQDGGSGSRQGKDQSHRSKHRHSLGEFLLSPLENDQRRKKSPMCFKDRDGQRQSPNMGRRSGGKGHKGDRKITPRAITEKELSTPPPVFRLDVNEFPSLGNQSPSDLPRMPGLPEGVKVVTASRRITPTPLHTQTSSGGSRVFRAVTDSLCKDDSHGKFEAPEVFGGRLVDNPRSLDEERKLLREQKARIGERTTPVKGGDTQVILDPCSVPVTPTKASLERLFSVPEITRASRFEVTMEHQLDILADLYSTCIEEQLVPNLTMEFYFLVQLLTAKGSDNYLGSEFITDPDEVQYFQTVHNAVYFAVTVIRKQQKLIFLLDKGSLRLLCDNQRIADFDLELKNELNSVIEHNNAKSYPRNPPSPIGGVSFQADTDNRQNFPSDRSFQLFKKQRDAFYELLREWQENHMSPGWSLPDVQGYRIQALVASKVELTNHIHFTRLFQSQLIQMCKGDHSLKTEGDDEHISLLSQLKQSNPEKFKRLQERFIMPSSVGGPCPLPSFPGCQEFFRDFILVASSHAFNQHLTNTLAAKIAELNNLQITPVEMESNLEELHVEQEDREHLAGCLLTLRLLAKFLGFVTFLPYQSPERLPDSMHSTYLSIRNQLAQPMDVLVYLKAAQVSGRTALTVPWVVEFLSQMDRLAPELQYFQLVCLLLLQIHRSASRQLSASTRSYSHLLVLVVLGWLFELPVFPEGLFFKALPVPEEDISLAPGCIDCLNLVDQCILYSCCPYLGEVRNVLIGFAVGSSSRNSNIRKITPLTTEKEILGTLTDKQLQFQLEENFFHNHPASLKRTVEFVADRVASNHIKAFRVQFLPSLLLEATQLAESQAKEFQIQEQDSRVKRRLMSHLEEKCRHLAEKGRQQGCSTAVKYSHEKCASILAMLLPEETSADVVSIATQIASRIAQDKVKSWMASHITKSMLFKDASGEFEKKLKHKNHTTDSEAKLNTVAKSEAASKKPKSGDSNELKVAAPVHDMESSSPSDILISLKDMLQSFLSPFCKLDISDVLLMLKTVNTMLNSRQDVILPVMRSMARMTVDLAYCLVLRYPCLWQPGIERELLSLWKGSFLDAAQFDAVLCSKHLYWLQRCSHPQESWKTFTALLMLLLREDLVTGEALESSCLSRLQAVCQEETFHSLAICICQLAESYHKRHKGEGQSATVFVEALDWLYQLTNGETQAGVQFTRDFVKQTTTARNIIVEKQSLDKLQDFNTEQTSKVNLNAEETNTCFDGIIIEDVESHIFPPGIPHGTDCKRKDVFLLPGGSTSLDGGTVGTGNATEELLMSTMKNTSCDTTLSSEGTITGEQVQDRLSLSCSPVSSSDCKRKDVFLSPGGSTSLDGTNLGGKDCDLDSSNLTENNNIDKKNKN